MTMLATEVLDRFVRILRPGSAEVEGLAIGLALFDAFDALPTRNERIAALVFVLNIYPLIEFTGEKTSASEYPSVDRYARGGSESDLWARVTRALPEHLRALVVLDHGRAPTDPVDDVLAARVWEYFEQLPSVVERACIMYSVLQHSLFLRLAPLPVSRHGRGTITETEVGRALVQHRDCFSALNRCFLDHAEIPEDDDIARSAALLDVISSITDARERAMALTVVLRIVARVASMTAARLYAEEQSIEASIISGGHRA
jgi:hypothetical protein